MLSNPIGKVAKVFEIGTDRALKPAICGLVVVASIEHHDTRLLHGSIELGWREPFSRQFVGIEILFQPKSDNLRTRLDGQFLESMPLGGIDFELHVGKCLHVGLRALQSPRDGPVDAFARNEDAPFEIETFAECPMLLNEGLGIRNGKIPVVEKDLEFRCWRCCSRAWIIQFILRFPRRATSKVRLSGCCLPDAVHLPMPYFVDFDPVAVSLGPLSVHWYGIMYLLAFAAFWWLGTRRASRADLGWTELNRTELTGT